MKPKLNYVEQFFYERAGYSYDPAHETPEEGRVKNAKLLADAERWATEMGYSFEWQRDPDTYFEWICTMYDMKGSPIHYLCGIDFGKGGTP